MARTERRDRRRSERTKRKRGIGDVISTIIMIVALAVFCYAGYHLFTIYMDYKAGTDEYSALEEFAYTKKDKNDAKEPVRETEGFVEDLMAENETFDADAWGFAHLKGYVEGKEFEKMENPIDFASLKEINEDVIGWIEMEAVDINYPIVQGADNDYYLHRTFRGQDNFAGSIFLDYQNRSDFSDRNTIVYGHNMKNGSMFGILKNYREQETYDKSRYLWIYTPELIYKYEIFSCAEVDAYSNLYQIIFSDAQDFDDFVANARSWSLVKSEVPVNYEDSMITLSTCTGNDATRFIVQAKRVRTYQSVPKEGGYGTAE